MSATVPPVVRLGNDIARNLAHLPAGPAEEAVATHIRKFWDPRMRRELVAAVRSGTPDAAPLLVAAVEAYLAGDIDRAEVSEPSGG